MTFVARTKILLLHPCKPFDYVAKIIYLFPTLLKRRIYFLENLMTVKGAVTALTIATRSKTGKSRNTTLLKNIAHLQLISSSPKVMGTNHIKDRWVKVDIVKNRKRWWCQEMEHCRTDGGQSFCSDALASGNYDSAAIGLPALLERERYSGRDSNPILQNQK